MTIGQNLIEPQIATILGANAALVGDAAHDTVANFLGGIIALEGQDPAAYYLPLSDAVNGTTIKILQPGIYSMRAEVPVVAGTGGATVRAAISLDALLAQLSTNPLMQAPGAIKDSAFVFGASVNIHLAVEADLYVTQAMANNPAQGIARLQWSNNTDAAPVAGTIVIAEASIRVVRIGNLDA